MEKKDRSGRFWKIWPWLLVGLFSLMLVGLCYAWFGDIVHGLTTSGSAIVEDLGSFDGGSPSYNSGFNHAHDSIAPDKGHTGVGNTANGSAWADVETDFVDVKQPDRKLVIMVDMTIETMDYHTYTRRVLSDVTRAGGYVESMSEDVWINNGKYMTACVRLPYVNLDAFLNGVEAGGNVTARSESRRDVTETYSELKLQIAELETEYERVLAFMEQAESMEQMLQLEQRLTEIRYDMSRYEEQLQDVSNKVDYATVYLTVYDVSEYTEEEPAPEPEVELTFWQKCAEGFKENLELVKAFFGAIAVMFISGLPVGVVILVFAIALVFIIKAVCKKIKRVLPERKRDDDDETIPVEVLEALENDKGCDDTGDE